MNVSDIRKLMESMAQTGLTEFEWSTETEKSVWNASQPSLPSWARLLEILRPCSRL